MANERTKKGLAYEDFYGRIKEATTSFSKAYSDAAAANLAINEHMKSCSPEERENFEELQELNEKILRMKLNPQMVHQDEIIKSMSVAFVDDDFIGSRIMPDVSTAGKLSGLYWIYNRTNLTSFPDDTVANGLVDPNEISEIRSKGTYTLTQRSLKETIEYDTINNQSAPLDEMVDLTNSCLYGLEFSKEIRVANTVLTAANYATANKTTLTGTAQFSDPASDPIGVIDDAKNALVKGKGPVKLVMYAGVTAMRALKKHSQLLNTLLSTSTSATSNGGLSKDTIAGLLGVDEIVVGTVRKNTGTVATANYATRIWGEKFIWVGYVAKQPSIRSAAFGYSFVKGPTSSDLFFLPERGANGVYQARASNADQQLIVSPDSGYLITNAVA